MENIKIIQDNNIQNKQNKKQNMIFAILMTILIILVIVLFTFVFVCAPVKIKGDSMNPSLSDGDIIMISKVHKQPVLGDIVVYQKPNEKNMTVIKRVVAVEGDVLYFWTKQFLPSFVIVISIAPYYIPTIFCCKYFFIMISGRIQKVSTLFFL